ncbi:ATP-binding protein [Cognatiyoonia sp.]|uniref:ATP-binding protein n=1 Tax=Cognatiyoonia sp. TaxID=2211652 RepID=UPI003F6A0438
MFFRWLKQYMPRGLYLRAAFILLLPVLTIQLLVSVVFIQRHFEGVTKQMTQTVSIELRFLADTANDAAHLDAAQLAVAAVAQPLALMTDWLEAAPEDVDDKPLTDFTGNTVRSYLRQSVPALEAVSLADRRQVTVWIGTDHGPMEVTFRRSRVSASNPHQLLVIMVVLGAVMTAISYFFLRNQLRPIKRMANAAQAFGKGQIVDYLPAGATEVRAAGAAFLDMRNRIERQTQNRTLMLSGVSHDLRTPLTRLRLGLSMLDDEEAKPLIADVDEMQHLVDGFLDFARDTASDQLERVDPQTIVEAVVQKAQRAGHAVTLRDTDGCSEPIKLRVSALNRALDNLCSNAVRYGSKAEVSVHVTPKSVRFTVQDDGPGIPADFRDAALRPFERLDPSRNQDRGSGVGLGLSIVNDIARSHGGVLRLGDSDTLGGLKAEIVLPR